MARQLTVELVGDARKFTKSLDDASRSATGFGDKVQGAGRKMTAFVSVPVVAFLGAATKAAVDDAAAQDKLAATLETSTGATKAAVAQVEKWIEAAMNQSTFTDDELRPSFETLVRSTNDAAAANRLLAVAMDVAAGKGIPLETAALAVTKAQEGNFAAVNKLVPGLIDLSDKTITAEEAVGLLAKTFSGQANAATETAAGKAKNAARDFGELQEKIGAQLLPVVEKLAGFLSETLIPLFDKLSGDNGAIALLGLAFAGPLLANIKKVQAALTVLGKNPLILVATGAVVVGSKVKNTVENEGWAEAAKDFFLGDKHGLRNLIPGLAAGGVVTSPTLAMVGEAGPEAIIPLSQLRAGTGGGTQQVNVHVSLDGRDIHQSLLRVQRTSGSLGFR